MIFYCYTCYYTVHNIVRDCRGKGHMTNYKARVLVDGDPQTNYIIALEKETSSLKWMQKVQFNDREDSGTKDIIPRKRSLSQKKPSQ